MNGGHIDRLGLYIEEERQQRASTILKDVSYVIEAHFDLTARSGRDDSEGKHLDMFNRRAAAGQCFHQPCLGTREFPAEFGLVKGRIEKSHADLDGCRDLGWMLYDIDFEHDRSPKFYRPIMIDGVIDVAKHRSGTALQ